MFRLKSEDEDLKEDESRVVQHMLIDPGASCTLGMRICYIDSAKKKGSRTASGDSGRREHGIRWTSTSADDVG